MILVTFEYNGTRQAGVLEGEQVRPAGMSMNALIDGYGSALCRGDAALPLGDALPLSAVRLLAPIPDPRQDVLCLGMNYVDHSQEAAQWGKDSFVKNAGKAVYFSKRAHEILGPDGEIDGHFDVEEQVDYECELAVVLGRDAYKVPREEAMDYVLGYSILNDVSGRELQKAHKQFYFGKSLDTYTVMGPWIVTRDALPQPPEYDIRCFVNGEARQSSNTRYMIFDVQDVISDLSRAMTLTAGTIIAMGTPAGVGMGFDPPRFLKSGDVIRCEIDGIGALKNTVK